MKPKSNGYLTSHSPTNDDLAQLPNRSSKYDLTELGIGLLCFIVLGLAAALGFILIKQQSNSDNIKEVKQTNQILVDCTTPGHKCYEESKKNTAQILIQINNYQKRAVIAAIHCAKIGNYSVIDISNCVNRTLK